MTIVFPSAPKTPIVASFMVCKTNEFLEGTYEHCPEDGDVIVFLPYLDLPNEALKSKSIAFLTAKGERGWITKEDIDSNFDMIDPKHELCSDFWDSFSQMGWEVIPILWIAIDWEKHFATRGDDESYDPIAESYYENFHGVKTCEWCGHPELKEEYDGKKCEACNWSERSDKKHARIVYSELNASTNFLDDRWA